MTRKILVGQTYRETENHSNTLVIEKIEIKESNITAGKFIPWLTIKHLGSSSRFMISSFIDLLEDNDIELA